MLQSRARTCASIGVRDVERLQKVLARAGVGSRRKCEELIASGRVTVNGVTITELGTKVDPATDVVKVDGRPIRPEQPVYILFNKPKGVVTSVRDPQGRKVVTDFIKGVKERIYPVGRLDYDTEGLLILTNDGQFANLLMHPSHGLPKTYHATVRGIPHGSALDKLREGVMLDDGPTAPAEVEYFDIRPEKNETVVSITIHEGKNRQVRRMFEAISHPVIRLKRVQYGPLALGGLPRGKFRFLREDEVRALEEAALQSHKIQKTPG